MMRNHENEFPAGEIKPATLKVKRLGRLRADVPRAEDISPTNGEDLDERNALEHFLGRDVPEILELLRDDHFESLQEDLMFMGRRGFEYYLPAVLQYVQGWTDEDFGWYAGYLIPLMESRMNMEGATEFGIRHYAMSAEEMAANPCACALRAHCMSELERMLAAGGTAWLAPAELREHLERWQGLFNGPSQASSAHSHEDITTITRD